MKRKGSRGESGPSKKKSCCDNKDKRTLTVYAGMYNERCDLDLDGDKYEGGVAEGVNLGHGEDIQFSLCAECGQLHGTWPVPRHALKIAEQDDSSEKVCSYFL